MKSSSKTGMNNVQLSICIDAMGSLDGHVKEHPAIVNRSEAVRHILSERGTFTDGKYVASPWATVGVSSREGVPKKDIDVGLPDVILDGLDRFVENNSDVESRSALVEIHIREYFEREWPDRTKATPGSKPVASDYV